MPSIEVVSIGQQQPSDFSHLSFAVRSETELESHRGLFQEDFNRLTGVIYHLGNPEFKIEDKNGFFAYVLLSEESQDNNFFEIDREFRVDFEYFINNLLIASPVAQVFFTSDWQFEPEKITKGGEVSLMDFWDLHDRHQLQLNASYTITKT
jgi:hypothetical protein